MPECRTVALEGLAWPSARRRRHTAARGMRPVVPVIPTSSGSHTLRTRGEVPELIGDAPITMRSEPLTECNLPVGKAWQTWRGGLDDHQHPLVRATFGVGPRLAPAAFYPDEFMCLVCPETGSDQALNALTQTSDSRVVRCQPKSRAHPSGTGGMRICMVNDWLRLCN